MERQGAFSNLVSMILEISGIYYGSCIAYFPTAGISILIGFRLPYIDADLDCTGIVLLRDPLRMWIAADMDSWTRLRLHDVNTLGQYLSIESEALFL
jgi:hypothetical protein